MEKISYYFISYQETRRGISSNSYFENDIISIHPLQWQIENRENGGPLKDRDIYYRTLLSWHEITEEEYNNYQESFNDY